MVVQNQIRPVHIRMTIHNDLSPENAVLNLEGKLVLEEVDCGERGPGRH